MCLTESRSHAVESEWQGRQEAQSLPGWAVGDVLSSMPRCPPGSLRSVQLPLDHLVEKRDRAVGHRRSNGRRSHVPVWGSQWCSVCGEEEGSKNRSLRNPVTSWCALDTSPPQANPEGPYRWDRIQTSEVESQWCPAMRGWTGGSDDWQCQKQQKDPVEWGLMIWNLPLRLSGLQWLRVVQSLLNGHSWNLTV